jgi:serine/threonine protein kinase
MSNCTQVAHSILIFSLDPPIAKLTDFGHLRFTEPDYHLSRHYGTIRYAPPETTFVVDPFSPFPLSADVWALGNTLFAAVTQYPLYDQDNEVGIGRYVIDGVLGTCTVPRTALPSRPLPPHRFSDGAHVCAPATPTSR